MSPETCIPEDRLSGKDVTVVCACAGSLGKLADSAPRLELFLYGLWTASIFLRFPDTGDDNTLLATILCKAFGKSIDMNVSWPGVVDGLFDP